MEMNMLTVSLSVRSTDGLPQGKAYGRWTCWLYTVHTRPYMIQGNAAVLTLSNIQMTLICLKRHNRVIVSCCDRGSNVRFRFPVKRREMVCGPLVGQGFFSRSTPLFPVFSPHLKHRNISTREVCSSFELSLCKINFKPVFLI